MYHASSLVLQDDISAFEGISNYEYFKYNKIRSLNINLCESWNQNALFCMKNSQRSVSGAFQAQKYFHYYVILKSEHYSEKQITQYLVISIFCLLKFSRTILP